MASRKPQVKEVAGRPRKEPVALDTVIEETDEEANWLAILRRARKALGNDATPGEISKWIEKHPNGE